MGQLGAVLLPRCFLMTVFGECYSDPVNTGYTQAEDASGQGLAGYRVINP